MRNHVTYAAVLGLGILAAGAVVATGADAHAAPYVIKAGTQTSGTTTFTATTTTVNWKDTTSGVTFACTAATLTGTLKLGTLSTGTAAGTVNGNIASVTGCTGPAGLKYSYKGVGTWQLNISDTTGGVTTGTVSRFVVDVDWGPGGPSCSYTIGAGTGSFTGTVTPGTTPVGFTNSSLVLAAKASNPGALGAWNVHGAGTNHVLLDQFHSQAG